jgi:hypothetical protein
LPEDRCLDDDECASFRKDRKQLLDGKKGARTLNGERLSKSSMVVPLMLGSRNPPPSKIVAFERSRLRVENFYADLDAVWLRCPSLPAMVFPRPTSPAW